MEMTKLAQDFFNSIPKDKHGIDLIKFEEMMITGEIEKYLLIDVRNKPDYLKKHIPGSINIPYIQMVDQLEQLPVDKKTIIISKEGITAAQISSLLNASGYNTWVLREGIEGYIDIGGEVENGEMQSA